MVTFDPHGESILAKPVRLCNQQYAEPCDTFLDWGGEDGKTNRLKIKVKTVLIFLLQLKHFRNHTDPAVGLTLGHDMLQVILDRVLLDVQ